jgi:hypothetical protein
MYVKKNCSSKFADLYVRQQLFHDKFFIEWKELCLFKSDLIFLFPKVGILLLKKSLLQSVSPIKAS